MHRLLKASVLHDNGTGLRILLQGLSSGLRSDGIQQILRLQVALDQCAPGLPVGIIKLRALQGVGVVGHGEITDEDSAEVAIGDRVRRIASRLPNGVIERSMSV